MKLIKYTNFDHKITRHLDQYEFSWDIHGQERMS